MSHPASSSAPSILILTGHSGSGKSTAIHALEDAGYYCVDNLPATLVRQLVAEVGRSNKRRKLALVMDLRDAAFVEAGPELVRQLRREAHETRLLFLQAQQDALVRRYSQTRRLHPLDDGQGLRAAIAREQAMMEPLRELADETIDTSHMSPHALRHRITAQIAANDAEETLRISVMSFGFKHGVPLEADMVLDVRFLPNPFFDPELGPMDGRQGPVSDFVLEKPEAQQFLRHALALLRFLLPHYGREGKRYFTLAIGCTGGRHRSVALAERIVAELAHTGTRAEARHRDVERHLTANPAAKAPEAGAGAGAGAAP